MMDVVELKQQVNATIDAFMFLSSEINEQLESGTVDKDQLLRMVAGYCNGRISTEQN